jgi:hypothetical protein
MEEKNNLIAEQGKLPYFDQYFKHNDYIQNFELAAAMDITQHRIFDTLISCVQTLKHHKHQYLFNKINGSKLIKMNLDFFMQRYLKSYNIKSMKKTELRQAIKSLAQIVIIKDTEDGIRARPVFQEVFANIKQNRLEIELSQYFSYDSLVPGKETKSPGYTRLLNSNQVLLKSIYARIFYQYFLSKLVFKNNMKIELELEKLHRILGLVDEDGKFLKGKKGYAETSQFKRRCIKESIDIINKHTELTVKVEDIKCGRRVTGFIFYAQTKNKDFIMKDLKITQYQFKNKDDFVVYMKIHYKNKRITNAVPKCPVNDFLILNDQGMLCLENENGIYRYSNNNQKDSEFAKKTWQWLYDNIEVVGVFKHMTEKDKIENKFIRQKININKEIFEIQSIDKENEYWIITIKNDNSQSAVMKISVAENIEKYLETIKV